MSIFETATQAALVLALVLMVLDVITGIAKAIKNKNVDSSIMREGLWHKAGFIGLIVLSGAVEYAIAIVPMPSGVDIPEVPLIVLACAYIVVTEIVSNFENLCQLNPQIADSYLGKLVSQLDGKE